MSETNLKIKDIEFGKTDALNEFSQLGAQMFVESFYNYGAYNVDKFIEGSNYYLCGDKGAGKTAMLKYLQVILSEDYQNIVIPIRFKSDFDDQEKRNILVAAGNVREEVAEGHEKVSSLDSAVVVWQVYIINQLFITLEKFDIEMFQLNKEYRMIERLLKIMYSEAKSQIIPTLTQGKFSISANSATGLTAEIELEIGFDKTQRKADYQKTAKYILENFKKLEYVNCICYILFDELELSVRSTRQFNRDLQLVRDLVIAISKLNEVCKSLYFPIHTIASIRNEVVQSAVNAGYELNKLIEDFGVKISWYEKGASHQENQLVKIIEHKILASEKAAGLVSKLPVWERYFPDYIHNDPSRKYILNNSWLRPRDIVRLLNSVKNKAGEQRKFTQSMFDQALQDYSISCWTEICEELRLKFNENEINAINKLFANIQVPFTFGYLSERATELSKIYDYVDDFFKKYKLVNLLEFLFRWGVIGNTGQKMVFRFLGDLNFSPTEDMIIHTPLRRLFNVTSRPKVRFLEKIYND